MGDLYFTPNSSHCQLSLLDHRGEKNCYDNIDGRQDRPGSTVSTTCTHKIPANSQNILDKNSMNSKDVVGKEENLWQKIFTS
jgi:hypothetical protein